MKPIRTDHTLCTLLAMMTATPVVAAPSVKSVEFFSMSSPSTVEQKAAIYTNAKMQFNYKDGTSKTYDLQYQPLANTNQVIGGGSVGGILESSDKYLSDKDGILSSDAPDGSSLIKISGIKASSSASNPLALVTQFEYRELAPNDGTSTGSFWSKLPATMGLFKLDQNKKTGALSAFDYDPISFSKVNGGWIHCGSTLSAWNTHLSSEEYEPDAKVREGLSKATDSDDGTDINSFSQYYFGDKTHANPYRYGLVPEVSIKSNGTSSVVKHYATGRFAREMLELAADNKTAISGDDGANTGLFMFVADQAKNLSAGTIYAAKAIKQTDLNLDLQWINLGHAKDKEIEKYVTQGVKFSDLFDVSITDPTDTTYKKVLSYSGTEWLRLKTSNRLGMKSSEIEQAAAFLETRRYAVLKGATTEFSKMEYITFNPSDRKFYITISRVEKGMIDSLGDIQKMARNDAGLIYEMPTAKSVSDSKGNLIKSEYVGSNLTPITSLIGGWNGGTKDAEGNQCSQDKICGPDNLRYVDSIRTLFIGEDTSRRNNNYVWAYNIDSKKLSKILSTPMNAEATGLFVAPNYNGFSYILSNFQHPGEGGTLSNYLGSDRTAVLDKLKSNWGNLKNAAVGYIGTTEGALPPLK